MNKDSMTLAGFTLSLTRQTELGHPLFTSFWPNGDRYFFDNTLCGFLGWIQYDTTQDVHYFGVWVHLATWQVFTYAEGDLSLLVCPSKEAFQKELERMEAFYGSLPPAFTLLQKDGAVTKLYDLRPTLDSELVEGK